jgi:hypothetical protein
MRPLSEKKKNLALNLMIKASASSKELTKSGLSKSNFSVIIRGE